MTGSLATAVVVAAVAALPANGQDLFELTLNSEFTAEQLSDLEDLFDVPPGLLAEDLQTYGFTSRVLPLRPAKGAAEVQETLLELGIVLEGVVLLDNPGFDINIVELSEMSIFSNTVDLESFSMEIASTSLPVILDDPFLDQPDIAIDVNEALGPVNTSASDNDSAKPATSAMQVTQGLPEGASVVQASTGQCVTGPQGWPFDEVRVAEVIRFGTKVLEDAGLGGPQRARILVVDSGLPAAFINQPGIARMLEVNRTEVMSGGAYAATAEDASRSRSCNNIDFDSGAVSYGFVTSTVIRSRPDQYCWPEDTLNSIAPPVPTQPMTDYDPAHGALVAGLAMGGPALLAELPELSTHLGIAMARIAQGVELESRGVIVSSSVFDAVEGIARAANPFPGFFAGIGHPQSRRFDVLNLSLSITSTGQSQDWIGKLQEYAKAGGLAVVAAGNGGSKIPNENLLNDTDLSLIGLLSSENGIDHAIVVGGTGPLDTGGVGPHPESNWSPTLVDIAAPATGALSWGLDGQPACAVGTSISTPQVSFVAAMLVSFGVWNNAEVKRRILATADIEPALFDQVRRGRVLNVANALDVFADLIWLTDPADPARIAREPLRVRILDPAGEPTGTMLRICGDQADFIDTRSLILWERRPGAEVEYWRGGQTITALGTTCQPATDRLVVQFLDDGRIETLDLADIARIVPSRFRLGPEALRVALAD